MYCDLFYCIDQSLDSHLSLLLLKQVLLLFLIVPLPPFTLASLPPLLGGGAPRPGVCTVFCRISKFCEMPACYQQEPHFT
ncbi:hypothetical protein FKM82_025747 [Ascaphus truei]